MSRDFPERPTSLTLVAAMARNRTIGRDGGLPWSIPEDLRRFRALTIDGTVIMGRRTWQSLPVRPLPRRRNVVLTSHAGGLTGAEIVHDVAGALTATAGERVAVIGGGEIYRAFAAHADAIELTVIQTKVAGDTFFPELDPDRWREVAREDLEGDQRRHRASERPFDISFVRLERK